MSDWVINIASEQFPAGKYMSKVNNKNRTKREIYLTLTINDAIGAHWRSGVFIVNFEHISQLVLLFLLLTLSRYIPAGLVMIKKQVLELFFSFK